MSDKIGVSSTRTAFYKDTVSSWLTQKDLSVLIVGGGQIDFEVFSQLGFSNVTISNISKNNSENEFTPYLCEKMDAEALSCSDNHYDYVLAHAMLHHCASPHRALLEMYRVARKAIIFIENRDSIVMKLLNKLGISANYEIAAVYYNNCQAGGLRNTHIPNYIYRWTEHEIEKTIASYAPHLRHAGAISYSYGSDVPSGMMLPKAGIKGLIRRTVVRLATPFYKLAVYIFPKQQNLFACKIEKPKVPEGLQPWLTLSDDKTIELNMEWVEKC